LGGVNPAHVTHGGLDAAEVDLVCQASGQAMQGSEGAPVLGVVRVEELCGVDSLVEKDLVEAVELLGVGSGQCFGQGLEQSN
jgi:hypothetical protein